MIGLNPRQVLRVCCTLIRTCQPIYKTGVNVLYMVRMDVELPTDLPKELADEIKAREKSYSQDLQRSGKWLHLWRIVGQYANVSIFDVEDNDELHRLLSNLPLFPYMRIQVTPLARHPSAIV